MEKGLHFRQLRGMGADNSWGPSSEFFRAAKKGDGARSEEEKRGRKRFSRFRAKNFRLGSGKARKKGQHRGVV